MVPKARSCCSIIYVTNLCVYVCMSVCMSAYVCGVCMIVEYTGEVGIISSISHTVAMMVEFDLVCDRAVTLIDKSQNSSSIS